MLSQVDGNAAICEADICGGSEDVEDENREGDDYKKTRRHSASAGKAHHVGQGKVRFSP